MFGRCRAIRLYVMSAYVEPYVVPDRCIIDVFFLLEDILPKSGTVKQNALLLR